MSKQKSMGELAHNNVGPLVFNCYGFSGLTLGSKRAWHHYAKILIAEHERRKRAKAKRGKK